MEPLRDLESEGHGEIHTVAFKVNDLEFQGHVIEVENSNYHHWIPWPRNYTHEKFHEEIRSGRPKSRGVATKICFKFHILFKSISEYMFQIRTQNRWNY